MSNGRKLGPQLTPVSSRNIMRYDRHRFLIGPTTNGMVLAKVAIEVSVRSISETTKKFSSTRIQTRPSYTYI